MHVWQRRPSIPKYDPEDSHCSGYCVCYDVSWPDIWNQCSGKPVCFCVILPCYLSDKETPPLSQGWLSALQKLHSPCKLSYILLLSQVAGLLLLVIVIPKRYIGCISNENQVQGQAEWKHEHNFHPVTPQLMQLSSTYSHSVRRAAVFPFFFFPQSNPLHLSVCSSQHYHAVSVGTLTILG